MLRIRDIMTPRVFSLDADATTGEAASALSRKHIGGAPVRDGDGNFIGVVSLADLVNPEPSEWIRGEGTVADRMSPVIYAVYADDPALAAAELMELRHVHRLLVMSADGQPAGVISASDVTKAVAAGRDFSIEALEPDEFDGA